MFAFLPTNLRISECDYWSDTTWSWKRTLKINIQTLMFILEVKSWIIQFCTYQWKQSWQKNNQCSNALFFTFSQDSMRRYFTCNIWSSQELRIDQNTKGIAVKQKSARIKLLVFYWKKKRPRYFEHHCIKSYHCLAKVKTAGKTLSIKKTLKSHNLTFKNL